MIAANESTLNVPGCTDYLILRPRTTMPTAARTGLELEQLVGMLYEALTHCSRTDDGIVKKLSNKQSHTMIERALGELRGMGFTGVAVFLRDERIINIRLLTVRVPGAEC